MPGNGAGGKSGHSSDAVLIAVGVIGLCAILGFCYYRSRAPSAHDGISDLRESLIGNGFGVELGMLSPKDPADATNARTSTNSRSSSRGGLSNDFDMTSSTSSSGLVDFKDAPVLFTGSGSLSTRAVPYSDVSKATNDFGDQLGEGGSCVVYAAVFSGHHCAVKALNPEASNWDTKQFTVEVQVLVKLHHVNLVQVSSMYTYEYE